jgi:hypothetical protein
VPLEEVVEQRPIPLVLHQGGGQRFPQPLALHAHGGDGVHGIEALRHRHIHPRLPQTTDEAVEPRAHARMLAAHAPTSETSRIIHGTKESPMYRPAPPASTHAASDGAAERRSSSRHAHAWAL